MATRGTTKDDSNFVRPVSSFKRTKPRKSKEDLRFVMEHRNALFNSYAYEVIQKEIDSYQWNMILQYCASGFWTLVSLEFIRRTYTSGWCIASLFLLFPTALTACYTSVIIQETREQLHERKLWEKTLDNIVGQNNPEDFDTYLDRFPSKLKNTPAYKSIRRRHFELTCNIGLTRTAVF